MAMPRARGMVAIVVRADPSHRLVAIHGWRGAAEIVAGYREEMLARLGENVWADRRGEFEWMILGPFDDPAVKELVTEMNTWVGSTIITHGGERTFLEVRAGMVSYDDVVSAGIDDARAMMRTADTALCAALVRKKFVVAASENFVRRAEQQFDTAEQLLRSTPSDFPMYYQPIVHLGTGAVSGFEALMRWNSPDGLKTPGEFLSLAEETELVRSVGRSGITSALQQLTTGLGSAVDGDGFISVNLALTQLVDPDTSAVFHWFANKGLDMSRVWVELREDDVVGFDTPASRVVEELHALGCRIAVDDLGKGYSALSYVTDLPVSVLKVDNRLIHELRHSDANMAVVQSIADLAQRMGIHTVAEGIECPNVIPVLKELGFDYAQGYYFGYPEPPEVIFSTSSDLG